MGSNSMQLLDYIMIYVKWKRTALWPVYKQDCLNLDKDKISTL